MSPRYLLVLVLLLAGCLGTKEVERVDAGRSLTYAPGEPALNMEVQASYLTGEPEVVVRWGIPRATLVFTEEADTAYTARYDLHVELVDRDDEERIVATQSRLDTLRTASYDSTQLFAAVTGTQRLTAPPGRYLARVTLRDEMSGAETEREQAVTVPTPAEGRHLSRIHMEAVRDERETQPLLALHLPARLDSLRASIELAHADEPVEVRMALTQYPRDTTAAEPPFGFTPNLGQMRYRGVDFDEPDTLRQARRTVTTLGEAVIVEFGLPALEPGVYRVAIEAGEGDEALRQVRTLAVKDPAWPRVERLDQMVEAATYILRRDEMEHLREAETPEEMKRRFDATWARLIPERRRARNTIETYYERVEEANLLYTGYQEGWRTDRGMIYVILGPPSYVEPDAEGERWLYGTSPNDPLSSFLFKRTRPNEEDLIPHFVLQRSMGYENAWHREIDQWRDGEPQ